MSLSPQREKIREKFVAALKEEFAGKGLRFTKGEGLSESKVKELCRSKRGSIKLKCSKHTEESAWFIIWCISGLSCSLNIKQAPQNAVFFNTVVLLYKPVSQHVYLLFLITV